MRASGPAIWPAMHETLPDRRQVSLSPLPDSHDSQVQSARCAPGGSGSRLRSLRLSGQVPGAALEAALDEFILALSQLSRCAWGHSGPRVARGLAATDSARIVIEVGSALSASAPAHWPSIEHSCTICGRACPSIQRAQTDDRALLLRSHGERTRVRPSTPVSAAIPIPGVRDMCCGRISLWRP